MVDFITRGWRSFVVAVAGLAILLGVADSAVAQHSWPLWNLSTVPDSGIAVQAELGPPLVAAAEECVYAMFDTTDVMQSVVWSRTDDDGRTWTPLSAVPLPIVSTINFGGSMVFASADDVLVYAPHVGFAGQNPDLAISSDRGASWSLRRMPLAGAPSDMIADSGVWICRYGNLLFVTIDRAVSWQGPYLVGGMGPVVGWLPGHLVARDGILHAAWYDVGVGGPQWLYATSNDHGVSWTSPVPVVVPNVPANGPVHTLVVGPGGVAIIAGGACCHSGDGGASWTVTPLAWPSGVGVNVGLFDGAAIVLVWRVVAANGVGTLWSLHSQDGGRTWTTAPQLLGSTGVAGPGSFWQATAFRGSILVVGWSRSCWSLPCTLAFSVFASNDGGRTWRGLGGPGAPWSGAPPVLVSSRSALLGVWRQQSQLGTYIGDPQADWLAGGQTLGGRSPGTGAVSPRLRLDRLALAGAALGFEVYDGLPGAPAVLAFGLTRLPLPFAAGFLTIDPFVHVLLGLGDAASARPGCATHVVPMAPTLWGLPVACQAFVIDPQAAAGVACSNGIELRM